MIIRRTRWPILDLQLRIPGLAIGTAICRSNLNSMTYEYLVFEWSLWKWYGCFRLYDVAYRVPVGEQAPIHPNCRCMIATVPLTKGQAVYAEDVRPLSGDDGQCAVTPLPEREEYWRDSFYD